MALPASRNNFKEYCLRRLGKPAIDINVTNEQIEDRIDEALDYWHEYHYNGAKHVFISKEITEADRTNRYLTLEENLFSIVNIFDIGDSTSTNNLFNLKYQISLHDIFDASHFRMQGYYMAMQNIAFLEEMLVGKTRFRFNQHTDRIYIDEDWNRIVAGTYLVLEGYERLDPDTFPDLWSDRFLIRYTTALIKRQWGTNLKKFEGMQMPGGLTFNGQQIYDEANQEIERLEEEMNSTFSLPVADLIG